MNGWMDGVMDGCKSKDSVMKEERMEIRKGRRERKEVKKTGESEEGKNDRCIVWKDETKDARKEGRKEIERKTFDY